MDAKAISEKSKELTKAVGSNAAPDVVKRILNDLKTGVAATEEVLRSTRIGVTVNKLKSYKNRDVASLAGEIVRKWRDEVEAKRGDQNGAKKSQTQRSAASPSGASSPAARQGTPNRSQQKTQPSPPPTPKVPLDKRNQKTDGIDVKPTGNAVRDRCAGLLYDGLVFMQGDAPKTVLSAAAAIEGTIHAKLGPEDKEAYKTKVRSLYQNLKNKANGGLRSDLISGAVSPDKLVEMTHEELKSAERRAEDRELQKENMRRAQAPQEEKSVSSSLQCSKCKEKKVSYNQAQTRSADEPMTKVFVFL